MTDGFDTDEAVDDAGEGQESSVITGLRRSLRETEAALKAAKEEAKSAAESARTQVQRELKIQQLVSDAGYPGLADIVAEKVQEPTAEAVNEFLTSRNLTPRVAGQQNDEAPKPVPIETGWAGIADLSQRVADAASGTGQSSLIDRINAAKNADEVASIMAGGG